jgi:hypothetical protein
MERKFVLIIESVFLLAFIAVFAFYYPSLILIGITVALVLAIILGSLTHAQLSIDIYYCPNTLCPYAEKLEKGKKCPKCGTEPQKFGVRQSMDLLREKHKRKDGTNHTRIRGRGEK